MANRSGSQFRFPTSIYTQANKTNSSVAQLNSVVTTGTFNEARIGIQTIKDLRSTPVQFLDRGLHHPGHHHEGRRHVTPTINTQRLWQSLMDLGFLWSGRDYAQAGAFLQRAHEVATTLDEPLTLAQLSASLQQPAAQIQALLDQLIAEFDRPEHGVSIREVAGGYKMTTKPEHHEAVRNFVRSLKPPLKLSLAALETLAVIAYKQPITTPEVTEIRGVQGAGVLKTLLERKLIAVAGRKNVIGKPVLYKTTKEFLIQFGLKDVSELPSIKEFEEIRRLSIPDAEPPVAPDAPETSGPADSET